MDQAVISAIINAIGYGIGGMVIGALIGGFVGHFIMKDYSDFIRDKGVVLCGAGIGAFIGVIYSLL